MYQLTIHYIRLLKKQNEDVIPAVGIPSGEKQSDEESRFYVQI